MVQVLISAFADVVPDTILKAVWGLLKSVLAALTALFRRVREALH